MLILAIAQVGLYYYIRVFILSINPFSLSFIFSGKFCFPPPIGLGSYGHSWEHLVCLL